MKNKKIIIEVIAKEVEKLNSIIDLLEDDIKSKQKTINNRDEYIEMDRKKIIKIENELRILKEAK